MTPVAPVRLRLGLLINPVAGIGGAVALRGSDGAAVQAQARARGGRARAAGRMQALLEDLRADLGGLDIVTVAAPMGPEESTYRRVGPEHWPDPTTAAETRRAVAALIADGIDLLLFAGGDGTARDVLDALLQQGSPRLPVLGLPAGVKMHSGIFAVSVRAAGGLLRRLIAGEVPELAVAEVRDLDEAALRAGEIRTRHYGELLTPADTLAVQQVKQGAALNPVEQQLEIAAWLAETLDLSGLWTFGPGSTVSALQTALSLPATLLGFDLFEDGVVRTLDADHRSLVQAARAGRLRAVITPTGGQGHLLGRGNHQLGVQVLEHMLPDDLWVIATPAKLASLHGRPLWIDLDDAAIAGRWLGHRPVVTGYETQRLWRFSDGGPDTDAIPPDLGGD